MSKTDRVRKQAEAAGIGTPGRDNVVYLPTDTGEAEGAPNSPPASTRGVPSIAIRQPEFEVNDAAADALRDDIELYQRGNVLVRVVHSGESPRVRRPTGAPRIERVEAATLRDRLSRAADWFKQNKKGSWIETSPPQSTVAAVLTRGKWPCRVLEGVADEPVIRPDGSLLDTPGYDAATGLLLAGHGIDKVPANPTRQEVEAAVATLRDVVRDFPFESDEHEAAWLALLLTPFARFAIDGPCPLFLIEANVRGTGKTLLADVVAIIATGRRIAVSVFPGADRDDELRKTVTSIALTGDRLILLDNVNKTLGGSALDSMLTATTWRDRVLGRNELTPELPLLATWVATANNAAISDDCARRTLPIRLQSDLERPEERDTFAIPDIRAHAQRERPRLAAAALTILRGFYEAGCPRTGLKPWGSFEAWSAIVRDAVVFAGLPDPCITREGISTSSTEAEGLADFMHGLLDFMKSDFSTSADGWFRAAHLVERLRKDALAGVADADEPQHARLREGIEALLDGKRLDASSVGKLLRDYRGRLVDGLVIERNSAKVAKARWRVVQKGSEKKA